MNRIATLALALASTACAPKVITRDQPVIVNRAVTVSCAAKRPGKPAPLPSGAAWDTMDVRQKAAAVGKYALDWQGYGETLNAATAGCEVAD